MAEEKKIIIDEDWKSQVEAEKEELERKRQAQATPGKAAGPSDTGKAAGPSEFRAGSAEMPPPSFEMLLTTLATEAMVAMGQIPHPATGKPEPNLDQARFFIGMLEMLEEKTNGNLSDAESKALEELLHQLRMAFVAIRQQAGAGGGAGVASPENPV